MAENSTSAHLNLQAQAFAVFQADDRPAMINIGDELMAREPGNAQGLMSVATAMLRSEKFGIAGMLFGALSKIRPDDAAVWNNLACSLQEYHPADALECLRRAMELQLDFEEPIQNCVSVLSTLGRFHDAVAIGRDFLDRKPEDPDVNHNLALAELQLGQWQAAWPRWKLSHKRKERDYNWWDVDEVQGAGRAREAWRWSGSKTFEFLGPEPGEFAEYPVRVVIYGEQGLGDEILAASQVDKAIASGAEVILEYEPRLEGLFRRSFPKAKVHGTLLEEDPAWVAPEQPTHKLDSMGLLELYAPAPFRRGKYLVADAQYRAMFRGLLDSLGEGMKVGIAWTGGVKAWDRAQRCIDPEVLGPLLSSPDCQFVSLEYQFEGPPPAGVHEFPWATAKGVDYDLTAALIAELDLVISVPQTCVDAAGALGVPCWVLTPPVPPWRFAEMAGDTAWIYESVEIIRRQGPFWQGAIARAANQLRRWTKAREVSRRAAE